MLRVPTPAPLFATLGNVLLLRLALPILKIELLVATFGNDPNHQPYESRVGTCRVAKIILLACC